MGQRLKLVESGLLKDVRIRIGFCETMWQDPIEISGSFTTIPQSSATQHENKKSSFHLHSSRSETTCIYSDFVKSIDSRFNVLQKLKLTSHHK